MNRSGVHPNSSDLCFLLKSNIEKNCPFAVVIFHGGDSEIIATQNFMKDVLRALQTVFILTSNIEC